MAKCKLFLGGLTKTTTTELLYETFAPFGVVVDAVVMERNGIPRGFGFVTFAEESSVEAVLRQQVRVDKRDVDIKRAVPEEEMESAPTKVFVGGLPQKVDRTSLKQHFSRYGDVRDAVVMMDRSTGRSRGFGFVRFAAPEAVEAVLSAPQVLEGQVVDCKRAQPADALPPPKNPRMRGEEKRAQRHAEVPDLAAQWAAMLAPLQGFDWSCFDPTGFHYDATPYFDPSLFMAPDFAVPQLPVPQMPLPSLPINKEEAAPLGDLSNILRRHGKTEKTQSSEPSPLGDLSNLLQTREKRSSGFSQALKDAMKQEASSVASLAFAN